MGYDLILRWD
jgi:hypothetical protein